MAGQMWGGWRQELEGRSGEEGSRHRPVVLPHLTNSMADTTVSLLELPWPTVLQVTVPHRRCLYLGAVC